MPLSFQAREKGLSFSLEIDDEIAKYVQGDPTRLRQIFINVVGNAVKFTETGEISVIVDIALERVRIRVRDTGIGITKQAQESLFEPYVQADPSTTRIFGGTGLGLTIVKGLVSAMKGKIDVVSEPEEGSTFTIYLPLELIEEHLDEIDRQEEIKLPSLKIVVAARAKRLDWHWHWQDLVHRSRET